MTAPEKHIVRRLLTAIDDDASVSQRKLSDEIGIAVGSVNWYLKRCVTKGLIKLQQAPVRRYLYYLTPQGFEEKARLTASFLQSAFELFRCGKVECEEFFLSGVQQGQKVIFLAGGGDFAEIAILSSLNSGARPLAVIDGDTRIPCAGVPVVASLDAAMKLAGDCPPDAILLTDLNSPRTTYGVIGAQLIAKGLSPDMIHIPKILNFRPER